VVEQAVASNEDAHVTACSCSPSFESTRISTAPEPQFFSRSWGCFFLPAKQVLRTNRTTNSEFVGNLPLALPPRSVSVMPG
jgi:hypothetical protein